MNRIHDPKTRIRKIASSAVAVGVFWFCIRYILDRFLWAEIGRSLHGMDLRWLLAAGAMPMCLWLLRTLRWYVMLCNIGIRVDLLSLYMCNATSMAFSIITPFQSGEAIKIELLRRQAGVARLPGYSTFAVERVIDLMSVVCIALWCILTGSVLTIRHDWKVWIPLLLICFLLVGLCMFWRRRGKGGVGDFLNSAVACMGNWRTTLTVMVLTVCSWLVIAAGWLFSLYSVSVRIGFAQSISLMSMVTLINILSCVPGAVGVSEVGSTQVLIQMGQPTALAQSGAVMLRIYGGLALILGAVHLIAWRWVLCRGKKNIQIPEGNQ